jgi:hypothetical protein
MEYRGEFFETSKDFWTFLSDWCDGNPPDRLYVATYSLKSHFEKWNKKVNGVKVPILELPKKGKTLKPVQNILIHMDRIGRDSALIVGNCDNYLKMNHHHIIKRLPKVNILCGPTHCKLVIGWHGSTPTIWFGSANMTADNDWRKDQSDEYFDAMLRVHESQQSHFIGLMDKFLKFPKFEGISEYKIRQIEKGINVMEYEEDRKNRLHMMRKKLYG